MAKQKKPVHRVEMTEGKKRTLSEDVFIRPQMKRKRW